MTPLPSPDAGRLVQQHIISLYQKKHQDMWLTVNGESMVPCLNRNDKIHIQFEDKTPQTGDIILFRVRNGFILHRVVHVLPHRGYVTKGDANYGLDEIIVDRECIVAFADVDCKARMLLRFGAKLSHWQGVIFGFAEKNTPCRHDFLLRICGLLRWGYRRLFLYTEKPAKKPPLPCETEKTVSGILI